MFGYGAAMPTGIDLISAERDRQMNELGYELEHDLEHADEELAFAAACYAAPNTIYLVKSEYSDLDSAPAGQLKWVMPWPVGWDGRPERPGDQTPEERLDELAKAGALVAAEMDRIMAEWDLHDGDA